MTLILESAALFWGVYQIMPRSNLFLTKVLSMQLKWLIGITNVFIHNEWLQGIAKVSLSVLIVDLSPLLLTKTSKMEGLSIAAYNGNLIYFFFIFIKVQYSNLCFNSSANRAETSALNHLPSNIRSTTCGLNNFWSTYEVYI